MKESLKLLNQEHDFVHMDSKGWCACLKGKHHFHQARIAHQNKF